MTSRLLLFLLLAAAPGLWAQDREVAVAHSANTTPPKRSSWKWSFEALPKSMQKEPKLVMTVFTEYTPAGKEYASEHKEEATYYEGFSGGYKQLGSGVAGEHPPNPDAIIGAMKQALTVNGFREAERPDHPPRLLVIFHWGSHNAIDPDVAAVDIVIAKKNLYDRASLIGGQAFADSVLDRMYRDEMIKTVYANLNQEAMEGTYQLPSFFQTGELGISSDVFNLATFEENMRVLISQIDEDVYFVIASAFVYETVATTRPRLLWRTKMTVNTRGVNMAESLPRLVAYSAPYLGKETPIAVPLTGIVDREGKVEIGEIEVLEVGGSPPDTENSDNHDDAPPAKTKPSAPAKQTP